jgi:hypothetical protein
MTQALDINERVAYREGACPPTAAPQVRDTTNVDKLAVFVITFGIAYAILYTFFERWNWPLFTYHPAINRLDLFKAPGIPEDGPPMFWYGWVVLSGIAATVVGAIATAISTQWLQRATVFFCVMAGLWPIFYALAAVIDQERIASLRMLPDKLTARAGTCAPNRIGVADGGTDQHGCAARGGFGGGGTLSVGGAGGERADTRRTVQSDRLASQARGARARRPINDDRS